MADHALTSEEQYKFDVITKVINKEIKPGRAAKLLDISTRQIRRLRVAVEDDGAKAVIHGLKGKQGNHHFEAALKEKATTVIKEAYTDFKPSFATEKLADIHGIRISPETTRLWMIEAGLWKSHKQKGASYYAWRPRKEYLGELEQFDGSYHYWLEERFRDKGGNPIELCLLASIDDATGKITKAQFADNEGVIAVFTFWKAYVCAMGKPLCIYLDKFSTYKITHKNAVDNHALITQFQRAMRSLAITLIPAHSPQAKGRIERLFKTLQDRLVKEMRLAKINTPKQANIFLTEVFIPAFNKRFAVPATKEGNVHRTLTKLDTQNLNRIFSIQSTRKVNNDFTIQFKNVWYQLLELQPTTVRPRETILVEEWIDGTVHLSFHWYYLNYTILPERPKRQKSNPTIITSHKLIWKPPANHPWRKPFKPQH